MRLWGGFFAIILALPCWASNKGALEILFGEGDRVRIDSQGYTYRSFSMQNQAVLQELADSIVNRLLETTIGYGLCAQVLDGRADMLQTHLGMSAPAAQRAARNCTSRLKAALPATIDPKGDRPRKNTFSGNALPRKYTIVRTNNPNLPLDSWTDAFTNETTFFVYHGQDRSDLNLRFLVQAFAHEMAIYFDGKSWPFGPEWTALNDAQKVKWPPGIRSETAKTAALNPAIATIMAAIRAYKIERQILRELVSENKLGPEPLIYRTHDFPILRIGCQTQCLVGFVKAQQAWIRDFYPALLAMAPQFRQERINEYSYSVVPDKVFEALVHLPLTMISKMGGDYDGVDLMIQAQQPEIRLQLATIESVMDSYLASDLKILAESELSWGTGIQVRMSVLNYLSIPLLSDVNTAMATGPRPRIRTGGTK